MKRQNFWKKLKKPLFVMAPMANVTDSAFRLMFAKYGKPDVTWTEFVSADGLISAGQKRLLKDLRFSPKEKPIVAQLFTSHPDAMKEAAKVIRKLGFSGLDINMGCPDKAVEKQGGGAALMRNPALALEVLQAAREGAGDMPVSVKTRIGYNKPEIEKWIRLLLEQKLPCLTVHLRTRKEMSLVPAHWDMMPLIVALRDEISPETLIIGNGDVVDMQDGHEKIAKTGCDGVMIGRGIFGRPWIFSKKNKKGIKKESKSPQERIKILLEHTRTYEKHFKGVKSFDAMKKHFKAYVSGWDGAKELRVKLMETESYADVKKVLELNHDSLISKI